MSKPTDLPSFAWGDPSMVLERLESMTCKGCRHQETASALGMTITFCKHNNKYDGIRCKRYAEKGGSEWPKI